MSPNTENIITQLKHRYHEHKPVRILFVCLGNICRSPAAEAVMLRVADADKLPHLWLIDSAGTGNYHIGDLPDSRMRSCGARRGYRFTHRCRQVTASDYADFDIIIGMDAANLRNLRLMAPNASAQSKIVGIGELLPRDCRYDYVPDPYYGSTEDFYLVLDLLEQACSQLHHLITTNEP